MHCYSITINLPLELQEQTVDITNQYLNLLQHTQYIQSYETCTSGKIHSHIGYQSEKHKSTSNETRKFKSCYSFSKKDHPNAIRHVSHDNWDILIGYISKDNKDDTLQTNIPIDLINTLRTNYKETKNIKPKKPTFLTLNQIILQFKDYYQDNVPPTRFSNEDHDTRYFRSFLQSIKGQYLPSTYQRIHQGKAIEFARNHYTLPNNYL